MSQDAASHERGTYDNAVTAGQGQIAWLKGSVKQLRTDKMWLTQAT